MDKFKGVKWQDLIKSPEYYGQQDRETLAPIISRLSSVANKRLRRMEQSGVQFSGYQGPDAISGVKKFGAQGKTLGQLRAEYKRLQGFLESPISTISGRKEEYYQAKKHAWRNATKEEREKMGTEPNRRQAYDEYKRTSKDADLFNEVAKLFYIARNEGWILGSDYLYQMRSSTQIQTYFQEQIIKANATGEDVAERIKKDLGIGTDYVRDYPEEYSTSDFF